MELTGLTEVIELTVATDAPPTAGAAVCVGGCRLMEVTDGGDGASKAGTRGGADGGTDAPPIAYASSVSVEAD